jgi:hypothetical protein
MGTITSVVVHWYETNKFSREREDSFEIFEPREKYHVNICVKKGTMCLKKGTMRLEKGTKKYI